MVQRLTDTMHDSVPSVFYTEQFHSMLESHILELVSSSATEVLQIDKALANQFEGDFFGLLTALGIAANYHWVGMRCNGLYSPTDYRSTLINIIVPAYGEVDEIAAIYTTSSGLTFG